MDGNERQPVLRCGRCNKPFDKQSSLKRHGYYCRSRRGIVTPRSRSCAYCARLKARCDKSLPACSTCVTKGVECRYPASPTGGPGRGAAGQHDGDAPIQVLPPPPQAAAVSAAGTLPETSTIHTVSEPDVYFDWNDPMINFDDSTTLQVADVDAFQLISPLPPTLVGDSATSTPGHTIQVGQLTLSPSVLSIPRQPPSFLKSIVPRQRIEIRLQKTAGLVLHTLKSYPLMLLHHNTPPPFIHPRLMPSGDVGNNDMEPLHNCISLLHMLGSRVPGGRKLFWKNVRLECERFREEHLRWNRWGLLSALQALSLYFIIRLDEGQTEHNNLDHLLVATVITVAAQYGHIDPVTVTDDVEMPVSWDDWIFKESRQRLCVIYQILDMLVYFDPAAMCNLRQKKLLVAPLPSKKLLWEADDEFAWKAESGKEEPATGRATFALAAGGELVKLDRGQVECLSGQVLPVYPPRDADRVSLSWQAASWDEWCSGMDSLGGLVMLAASLAA